eukprot:15124087-Alexandrium_andersonii.AAC.1
MTGGTGGAQCALGGAAAAGPAAAVWFWGGRGGGVRSACGAPCPALGCWLAIGDAAALSRAPAAVASDCAGG